MSGQDPSDWRTWSLPDAGEVPSAYDTPLALNRYALLERLPQSGGGEVWRGCDRLTGQAVIVKRVPALGPHAVAGVRREVTALRWLRLPGVVRLLDDGTDHGAYALVMESITGTPFPGLPLPVSWDRLAPRAIDLLRALDGVHRAGVAHRDLKPANVLVTEQGEVVIIDFGLAHGQALAPEELTGGFAGTVGYAAPEQFKLRATEASDLFAVGVMLFEALTGRKPWDDVSFGARRAAIPAPPLRGLAPAVPAAVAEVIDRLLATSEEQRPKSAEEAALALGAPSTPASRARLPATCSGPEALQALFHGPDTFLHLPEDAAALLYRQGQGDLDAMARCLDAWVGAGDARWEGDRLVVDRMALARIEHWEAYAAQLARGTPAEALLPRMANGARALLDQGRLPDAAAILELGLGLARQAIDAGVRDLDHDEATLLRLAAITALEQESIPAMQRALYAMGRAGAAIETAETLARLLICVRSAWRNEVDRAQEQLITLRPFDDDELESWRRLANLLIAQHLGPDLEAMALEALDAWAKGHAYREARLKGWWGNLRYRQGLYEQAATMHIESAGLKRRLHTQVASLANAASARLEALDLVGARSLAEEVRSRAATLRHSSFEALATWILRAAAYRAGEPLAPSQALVDAASLCDGRREGIYALQEACFAWRGDQPHLAVDLAVRAQICFEQQGLDEMAGVCEALRWAALGTLPDDRRDALVTLATGARVPDFSVQILGLLYMTTEMRDTGIFLALTRRAQARPEDQWPCRLDVLSYGEALAAASRGTSNWTQPERSDRCQM